MEINHKGPRLLIVAHKIGHQRFDNVGVESHSFHGYTEEVMITHVKFVSIPICNQDLALAFYTEKLGFKLVTDQPHDEKQRWIEMRIGGSDTRFSLFTMDEKHIGSFFNGALACDNVEKTYRELKERGVTFMGPPKQEAWGTFAVLEDIDGNKFVLSAR